MSTVATQGAVSCRGIGFEYAKGVPVLDGVDIEVAPGTIHGIVGPNGSGKTTLINVMSGFADPQRGTVTLAGDDVTHAGIARRAALGMRRTFQRAALVESLTCVENCVIGAWRSLKHPGAQAPLWLLSPGARRADREVRAAADEALRWAGVDPRWDHRPVAETPQAVHQLLQIAVAMMGRPRILILDEPGAGLTHGELELLEGRLSSLRDDGVTVILIEHHVRFVLDLSDAMTVLSAGRVIADGTPAQIRDNAEVREVYLG